MLELFNDLTFTNDKLKMVCQSIFYPFIGLFRTPVYNSNVVSWQYNSKTNSCRYQCIFLHENCNKMYFALKLVYFALKNQSLFCLFVAVRSLDRCHTAEMNKNYLKK